MSITTQKSCSRSHRERLCFTSSSWLKYCCPLVLPHRGTPNMVHEVSTTFLGQHHLISTSFSPKQDGGWTAPRSGELYLQVNHRKMLRRQGFVAFSICNKWETLAVKSKSQVSLLFSLTCLTMSSVSWTKIINPYHRGPLKAIGWVLTDTPCFSQQSALRLFLYMQPWK